MTVYVLHFDPPYQHARHYIGYTPDPTHTRRVREHMEMGTKGSPLVRAALQAGCEVVVAAVYPGAGRDYEAWLKARRDTRRWCPTCGVFSKPEPSPERMTSRFRDAKRSYECDPMI